VHGASIVRENWATDNDNRRGGGGGARRLLAALPWFHRLVPDSGAGGSSVKVEDLYALGATLGEGSYGTVRLATRKADGLVVAIKFINKRSAAAATAAVSHLLRVHWVAVPKAVRARRVNRRHHRPAPRRPRPRSGPPRPRTRR
jgi:serine/threonine protein kinase